jgi:hypothetical protein
MSGPLRISQHPAAATANTSDELVANQGGTTVKLTVGQLRATLAPAVHTHSEADIAGTISPSKLAQAGASVGQVLKWNGTAWAPAADNVGSGGGSTDWSALTGKPPAINAIDTLTPAADRVAYYTGANTAALAVVTGFARTLLDDPDAATARSTLGAAAAAHGHAIGDVTNLQAALDGKAAATHTHAIGDVTNLQAALDAKANASHTHTIADVTNLQAALDGKANASHTHTIADVTNLQAALDGKANASHTHTIANITNLQAALDAKANASHTHSEADITGTISPSKLAQAGATTGQVLKWNGTAWAPATDNVGTGGGAEGYASQRTITASGNITSADRNGVVYINGSGITATFVRTGFAPRDRVLLINIGNGTATISAGTDGFNIAGNNSFSLFPGEEREVVYEGTANPYWRVAVPSTIQLAANQVATLNNAGTGFEARTEKMVSSFFLRITGNVAGGAAEGQICMWGNKPCTLTAVRARTLGGTCSIQIRKNGTAINGFAAAVAQTTTVAATVSNEPLTQDDLLDVVVTNASNLTGLFITFLGVRTAD